MTCCIFSIKNANKYGLNESSVITDSYLGSCKRVHVWPWRARARLTESRTKWAGLSCHDNLRFTVCSEPKQAKGGKRVQCRTS